MACSCPECGSATIGTLDYCAKCEHHGCSSRRGKCVDDAPEIRTDGGEPTGESGSELAQFEPGQILTMDHGGRWRHVLRRFMDIDDTYIVYRVADATHTEYFWYFEDTLDEVATPNGVTVHKGTKPAVEHGRRVDGVLCGPVEAEYKEGER